VQLIDSGEKVGDAFDNTLLKDKSKIDHIDTVGDW